MNAILDWFSRALPKRDPRRAPAAIAASSLTANYAVGKNYDNSMMAASALRIDIVQACVERIASTLQSVPWEARGGGVRERKDLQGLLDRPDDDSGSNMRYWLAAQLALFGHAYVKAGFVRGQVNALYPLYPDLIGGFERDAYGNPAFLEYGTGASAAKIPLQRRNAHMAAGYAFRIGHKPLEFGWDCEVSPLRALGLSADIAQNLLKRAHDLSDARPNIKNILYTPDEISETQEQVLKEQIRGKQPDSPAPAGEEDDRSGYLILQGIDLKHIPIDDGLGEAVKRAPLDDVDRRIARAFGVPMALLGTGGGADQAKYASNYGESRLSFIEDTIIPRYINPIAEALTLHCGNSAGLEVAFNLNSVSAVQDKRMRMAAEIDKVSFLTESEKREICGFEARPDSGQAKASVAAAFSDNVVKLKEGAA